MSVGSQAYKFRNKPNSINTPTKTPKYNIFWFIHAYLQMLMNTHQMTPGPGIAKLYSYRMGTLSLDNRDLEAEYISKLSQGDKDVTQSLKKFADEMIIFNLITLFNFLKTNLQQDIMRDEGHKNCLSANTVDSIYDYCRFHQLNRASDKVQIQSNIDSLFQNLKYDATIIVNGVNAIAEINSFITTAEQVIEKITHREEYNRDPFLTKRDAIFKIVSCLFYIGILYYEVNLLRFNDQILASSFNRNIPINNYTLLALPFDPLLAYTCTDEIGTMSRHGLELMQSLSAVLSDLAGISCNINLSILKQTQGVV